MALAEGGAAKTGGIQLYGTDRFSSAPVHDGERKGIRPGSTTSSYWTGRGHFQKSSRCSFSVDGAVGSDFDRPAIRPSKPRFLMPRNVRRSAASSPDVGIPRGGVGRHRLQADRLQLDRNLGLIARGDWGCSLPWSRSGSTPVSSR